MSWHTQQATVDAMGFDTLAPLTPDILAKAKAAGYTFVVRYVHATSVAELEMCGRAGFAVMLVTYAKSWSGGDALNAASALGYPASATLWLDVESVTGDVNTLTASINAWCTCVTVKYEPGGYFGAGALLTWQEMTRLAVVRYWESCSCVNDRNGDPAVPTLGWNMSQLKPGNRAMFGTLVDVNIIRADARGRVPSWAVWTE